MRTIKFLFSLLAMLAGSASVISAQEKEVTLTLNFVGCEQAPRLFTFNGFSFDPVVEAVSGPEPDTYIIKLAGSAHRFYYLGPDDNSPFPFILGQEDGLELTGSCSNTSRTVIAGSRINDDYAALKGRMSGIRQEFGRQLMAYRQAKSKDDLEAVIAEMKSLDREKLAFLDSTRQANPFLGNILALNTYLSFFNNNNGRYRNEMEYFANEYFRFADFSAPDFNHSPWVYEAFRAYTQTLSSVGLPAESHRNFMEVTLSKTPAGSSVRQLAYGGVLDILERSDHENLVYFAGAFLNEFPDVDEATREELQELIEKRRAFSIGGTPPDFTQKTPNGEELSLSDLRGKVVLVDFWASWCGPCRQENPNVVRVYNEYRDKGFEILGVSLDNKHDNWVKAIEMDGLEWLHVSDLKGWKNEVAQVYSITAIPHTILLDREGRIIARNLRGPSLEQKLSEIFP